MLRSSGLLRALRLQSATFVENPVDRVATINLQISRTDPAEHYGFEFRAASGKGKRKRTVDLRLRHVPYFLVEASPTLDALFPDRGRIYAGTTVLLTAVNGAAAGDKRAALHSLMSGQHHSVSLAVQMGDRRTTRLRTTAEVAFPDTEGKLMESGDREELALQGGGGGQRRNGGRGERPVVKSRAKKRNSCPTPKHELTNAVAVIAASMTSRAPRATMPKGKRRGTKTMCSLARDEAESPADSGAVAGRRYRKKRAPVPANGASTDGALEVAVSMKAKEGVKHTDASEAVSDQELTPGTSGTEKRLSKEKLPSASRRLKAKGPKRQKAAGEEAAGSDVANDSVIEL